MATGFKIRILDAYSRALEVPTLSEIVDSRLRSRKENEFRPVVPIDQNAVIERNRLKWEKKAKKNQRNIATN